jgi:hypothetical protein
MVERDGTTRRDVLRKAAFVAPVVLTLAAVPSFASAGSGDGPPPWVPGPPPWVPGPPPTIPPRRN